MDIRSPRIDKTFIPLHILSHRLGLPETWLKAEAEAGRIPYLRVGRRLMFNFATVERVLLGETAGAESGREEVPCACDVPMVVADDDGETD